MASFANALGQLGEDYGSAWLKNQQLGMAKQQLQGLLSKWQTENQVSQGELGLKQNIFEAGKWQNLGQTYNPETKSYDILDRNVVTGEVRRRPMVGFPAESLPAKLAQIKDTLGNSPSLNGYGGAIVAKALGLNPDSMWSVKPVQDKAGNLALMRVNELTGESQPVTNPDGSQAYAPNYGFVPNAIDPTTGELRVGSPVPKNIPVRGVQGYGTVGSNQSASGANPNPAPTTSPQTIKAQPNLGGGGRSTGLQAKLPFDANTLAQMVARDPGFWSKITPEQMSSVANAAKAQGLNLVSPESQQKAVEFFDLATDADARLQQMKEQAQSNNPADQKALLFNHIAMTIGAVKGGRVTEAEIAQHLQARSLPEDVMQAWDQLATGRSLTSTQVRNFLKLGQEVRVADWQKARQMSALVGYQFEPSANPELPAVPQGSAQRVPLGSSAVSNPTRSTKTASATQVKAYADKYGISYGQALAEFQKDGITVK